MVWVFPGSAVLGLGMYPPCLTWRHFMKAELVVEHDWAYFSCMLFIFRRIAEGIRGSFSYLGYSLWFLSLSEKDNLDITIK